MNAPLNKLPSPTLNVKILIHRKGETYGPYDPEAVEGFIQEKRASLRDWASLEGSEERVRLEDLLRDEE